MKARVGAGGLFVLGLACVASAHTTFTTLFIDRKNQGDGTCVRMPLDEQTATFPIRPITSDDMACGRNGSESVPFVCSANKGSLLTFEFRLWPDAQQPGSIDPGHLGPCAVYVKKVDEILTESAAGGGWLKIWEDGFNQETRQWCVDRLVQNNGLLSVNLPQGLPSGYYLVRPEILALHWAAHRNDPQYFVGCAQIFLNSDIQGELDVPGEHLATIPGYVDLGTPGVTFDVYQKNAPAYPMPGPRVFIPNGETAKSSTLPEAQPMVQTVGLIPQDCLLKSANWCGKAIAPYSDRASCWRGVKECFAQSKECKKSAPPVGLRNCNVWGAYCESMNQLCAQNIFQGPPAFHAAEVFVPPPGELPAVWNDVFEKNNRQARRFAV
ncbi:endoglucanase b [Trichoderma arundinaceum]|uniref:lytic cellulose monooxygenase (C4-dehydrogenating) n=1 Tax=Trichoderma arundinaceum TaxID=490622 RepID=A0A395NMU0_TRIAR|nr:endoglucanase b [Trichoderma arundinaceum]